MIGNHISQDGKLENIPYSWTDIHDWSTKYLRKSCCITYKYISALLIRTHKVEQKSITIPSCIPCHRESKMKINITWSGSYQIRSQIQKFKILNVLSVYFSVEGSFYIYDCIRNFKDIVCIAVPYRIIIIFTVSTFKDSIPI